MPIQSDVKPTLLTLQRFNDSKKQRVMLICLLLGVLVLLTIGLQNISLQMPTPVNVEQQNDDTGRYISALQEDRVFIVVAFVLLLVLLILFISRLDRKWGIILLVSTVFISFIFYISSIDETIKEIAKPEQSLSTPAAEQVDSPTTQTTSEISTVEFQPPKLSNLFLLFISLAVILFFGFIVWMIFLWQRSEPSVMHIQPLEEIGEAARLALAELNTGVDERDAVIQCYARMSEVVMHSIHVERGASRTAAEFASRLEVLGLPGEATRRLTRLFEAARYSANSSRPLEIQEAKACLVEIARYCGEPV